MWIRLEDGSDRRLCHSFTSSSDRHPLGLLQCKLTYMIALSERGVSYLYNIWLCVEYPLYLQEHTESRDVSGCYSTVHTFQIIIPVHLLMHRYYPEETPKYIDTKMSENPPHNTGKRQTRRRCSIIDNMIAEPEKSESGRTSLSLIISFDHPSLCRCSHLIPASLPRSSRPCERRSSTYAKQT